MEEYKILKIHGYGNQKEAFVKVDAEDYQWLSQWSWKLSSSNGYARRTIRKKNGRFTTLYLHQLIMGTFETAYEVDHINGDHLDNRKSNLRKCNRYINTINHHGGQGICKSSGVCKHYGKYQARITREGKRVYLGRFDTIEDANKEIMKYDAENGYFVYSY